MIYFYEEKIRLFDPEICILKYNHSAKKIESTIIIMGRVELKRISLVQQLFICQQHVEDVY